MKYLEKSASVSTALVDFRNFFLSEGFVEESTHESLCLSRREVRKVISLKARSGTLKAFVSASLPPVDIGEPTASSSYWRRRSTFAEQAEGLCGLQLWYSVSIK